MLILKTEDMEKVATCKEVIDAMEGALLRAGRGEFATPLRTQVVDQGNTLLLMPAFGKSFFATKVITIFPKNLEFNRPTLAGLLLLNDGKTGEPLAIMNGAKLTALRTGAVAGVAIRHLSQPGTDSLGIVGAGVQGFHQAIFACSERPIRSILLYDPFSKNLDRFVQTLSASLPGVLVKKANSVEFLLEKSRLIITATNAEKPVFPEKRDLLENRCFIGIGSYKPTMREYPESLFPLLRRVYVDTDHALLESGDLLTPLKNGWLQREQVFNLSDFLQNKIVPETNATVFFKSVGAAFFDLAAAELLYAKAKKEKTGINVDI